MLCALGPEPASQAMRVLHKIDADRGIFVIDRAASAGNAHWVCSWFAIADNHKMKPKEFLDLGMFRQILQGQEGHQKDATNNRCFTCGTYGHWTHDCIVSMSQGLHNLPINQRLFHAIYRHSGPSSPRLGGGGLSKLFTNSYCSYVT